MRRVSPTSLKVGFRHLKLGAEKTLGEVLQMDYRLICIFRFEHDFREGVRALLVEKDNKPQWGVRLEDLTEDKVNAYLDTTATNDQLDLYVFHFLTFAIVFTFNSNKNLCIYSDVHIPDAEFLHYSLESLRDTLKEQQI